MQIQFNFKQTDPQTLFEQRMNPIDSKVTTKGSTSPGLKENLTGPEIPKSSETSHSGDSNQTPTCATPEISPQKSALIKKLTELNDQKGWEHISSDPCEMYKLNFCDTVASKGVAIVSFPFKKVIKFFETPDYPLLLNEEVKKYEHLHHNKEKETQIVHMEVKTPWPTSDRDFILRTATHREGNTFYVALQSCDIESRPETKEVVRGQINPGGYIIEKLDNERTKVTYVTDTDPKGHLPSSVKERMAAIQGETASLIQPAMKKAGF